MPKLGQHWASTEPMLCTGPVLDHNCMFTGLGVNNLSLVVNSIPAEALSAFAARASAGII